MKIIKKGNLPKTMQVTCKTCGAVLEIKPRHLKYERTYFDARTYWYKCRYCRQKNYVDTSKFPTGMYIALKKRDGYLWEISTSRDW